MSASAAKQNILLDHVIVKRWVEKMTQIEGVCDSSNSNELCGQNAEKAERQNERAGIVPPKRLQEPPEIPMYRTTCAFLQRGAGTRKKDILMRYNDYQRQRPLADLIKDLQGMLEIASNRSSAHPPCVRY